MGTVEFKRCIDCSLDSRFRVLATPENQTPRCATHLREFKKRQRTLRHASHVERTYDISAEDAHALLLLQGGRCWLCRKATGATKALAVDHDHATNEVRGRLCGPCNQFIGRLSDDPAAAQRLVAYLSGDTPYRRLKATQWLANRYGVTVDQAAERLAGLVLGDRGQYYAVTRGGIMEGPINSDSEPRVETPGECASCHALPDQLHTEYCETALKPWLS